MTGRRAKEDGRGASGEEPVLSDLTIPGVIPEKLPENQVWKDQVRLGYSQVGRISSNVPACRTKAQHTPQEESLIQAVHSTEVSGIGQPITRRKISQWEPEFS